MTRAHPLSQTNNQQNSLNPSVSQPSTSQRPSQPSSVLPSQQQQPSHLAPTTVHRSTINRGTTLRRVASRGSGGLGTQQGQNTSLNDPAASHHQQQTRTTITALMRNAIERFNDFQEMGINIYNRINALLDELN
ncbi:unnamed protein product [Didymodactylos carnosus]|uniref:Uncharacterized protein n=1 Tax=Didymodactylos carnosus TaxID=1234261 RepID=A0A8S2CPZ8_9BILA|nr:unnamed protein product [Didymodactylos carnosus]CAF3528038.1 unnamed protein product [Didymodactylos carnosus]